ncbi:MAG: hypothetical protein O2999_15210 [Nitrospirae bacterium]|nr:hypothetical protein [Nitrospirota bacterium]MDA1305609.1 hypothetical protein [Nitrospirota bacterium]
MKKIKRKIKSAPRKRPSLVVGFSGDDLPPAGFLAAWFDQQYGGPLHIRFPDAHSNTTFEARHTEWCAMMSQVLTEEDVAQWTTQMAWDHIQAVQIVSTSPAGSGKQDVVLFLARLARGLTLLTDGTVYDVGASHYFNPSDWSDRLLDAFHIEDHVQVKEEEHLLDGRQWFYTRGLAKFGLEEFEFFQPRGLPAGSTIDRLLDLSDRCVGQGKSPKVGEQVQLLSDAVNIRVVNHRTHALPDGQLNLREVQWDV